MSNNYQFMKLGDILVKEDIITQADLDKALIEQKDTREKLGHVLIKQGSVGEDDLVKAFSLQLGHDHILEEDRVPEINTAYFGSRFKTSEIVSLLKKPSEIHSQYVPPSVVFQTPPAQAPK